MSKVPFADVKNLIEKRDIKLYAIGVGNERDYNGQYLQALAKAGKGLAFGASDAASLTQVYAEIDKLEATKIDDKKIVQYTYFYSYPLFLALLCLLLFVYLRNARGL
jgi:Ca-activated chloride channel family protein